ncbi:MAG: UDP-glucose/GDP-mannose dehydrogenase family protein [Actinomycetales bacterium]|nr:UDP-glucose/GDP-mannose dehydrogenase family protein [Actinomycetales bacterium]
MRISVIGCGYLGAVHAAALASLGHDVIGVDSDGDKIALLETGAAPFFEPGLEPLLVQGLASGRLRFRRRLEEAAAAEVHFVTVGTPQRPDGSADLSAVEAVVAGLAGVIRTGALVVGKSTVPVGTAARLADVIVAAGGRLAWNPEFLREGLAVQDSLHPDRLVYGLAEGDASSEEVLDAVYAEVLREGMPKVVTDLATAELVKVSANAFLATKISFINAMAEIAEATGADVTQLADAIGVDARIGRRFLGAGVGFGGGCLPKDIRGFVARAEELGTGRSVAFLREIDAINLRRRERVVELARESLGGSLAGRRIAALGLAFKPDSDDVRDSPALAVAGMLADAGARVVAHDPAAVDTARLRRPDLDYTRDLGQALVGAEAVVVLTEWGSYRELDPTEAGSVVAGRRLVDARNCLDREAWAAAGWEVRSPGRPARLPLVARAG